MSSKKDPFHVFEIYILGTDFELTSTCLVVHLSGQVLKFYSGMVKALTLHVIMWCVS